MLKFFPDSKIEKNLIIEIIYMEPNEKKKASHELAVITTKKIINRENDIIFVSHDDNDGGWQFLDIGIGTLSTNDAVVVGFNEIMLLDPTLEELRSLPLGWCATRNKVNDTWQLRKMH